jgi:hypothetical protein
MIIPETDLMRAALLVAMHAAPNAAIQQRFSSAYDADRCQDGLTEGHVVRRTLERVLDGLKFGNWPEPR